MLPLCVVIDSNNNLVAQGEFSGDCTGYVLQTPADFAGSMTIAALFSYPDPVDFGQHLGQPSAL
ncbi:hypothetical protein QNM99_16990 [Pseudomonas sp. PCH446]